MFYVLLTFSIAFILIGAVMSIVTVRSFFSRNMAEVYDSLLGRNYVEKLERRKNKKKKKQPVNASVSSAMPINQMQQAADVPPIPVVSAGNPNPPPIPVYNNAGVNSGNTTVLTNESVNIGANNTMQSFEFSSGQTTLLTTVTSGSRLNIVKELYYIASNETMQ